MHALDPQIDEDLPVGAAAVSNRSLFWAGGGLVSSVSHFVRFCFFFSFSRSFCIPLI